MNQELEYYTFLPFFRIGLANSIDVQDNDAGNLANTQRATMSVFLKVNDQHVIHRDGTVVDGSPTEKIQLYGPGDIIGLDHRVIVRSDPMNNVGDFEPNYFPAIEFSELDLPWRFTPAMPDAGEPNRLRPWMCLIVLKAEVGAEEFSTGTLRENQPLPSIYIESQAVKFLPDLSASWAWAHVQFDEKLLDIDADNTNQDTIDGVQDNINTILQEDPSKAISRLLCARRLEPGILYHAFVVPTFESGRLAGLGEQDLSTTSLLQSAWDSNSDDLEIPYYYKWAFRTGQRGDFEHLVRLLEAREIDPRVGVRDMDCSKPGYQLPSVHADESNPDNHPSHVLRLEGALKAVNSQSTIWNETKNQFQKELADKVLNLPTNQLIETDESTPLVVPPIYGRWHAGIDRVDPDALSPNWTDELNLDPRNRAVAGFGTLVVQENQEQLMHAAWQQIGDVEEANAAIERAQAASEISEKIRQKHFASLNRGLFLRLCSPLLSHVLVKQTSANGYVHVTASHIIDQSPIPKAALDPAFRRLYRPGGAIRNRQKQDRDPMRGDVLERLNDGEIAAAGEPKNPDGELGLGDTAEQNRPNWAKGWLWKILKYLPLILILIAIILLLVGWLFGPIASFSTTASNIAAGIIAIAAWIVKNYTSKGNLVDNLKEENLTSELVEDARPPVGFESRHGIPPEIFRQQASKIQAFLNYKPEKEYEIRPINVKKIHETVYKAVDPANAILNKTKQRIAVTINEEVEMERIMAAPEFEQPMYEHLAHISQELLVPGLEYIPSQTVGFLKSNRDFIESYLVGLNHEMARELKWRKYPTDQRGSYFRQFWDVSRYVPSDNLMNAIEQELLSEFGDEWNFINKTKKEILRTRKLNERLKDIDFIHKWRQNLGQNELPNFENAEKMVLVIRGDLLKKYPNTIIYSARARWEVSEEGKDIRRPIIDFSEANTKSPIFEGKLNPDITFIGFDLDEIEIKGSPTRSENKPGWFFVLEEPLTESRFGMDVPDEEVNLDTWDNLSWHHIESNLTESRYIDNNPLTSTPQNKVVRPKYVNGEPVFDANGNHVFEPIEPDNINWNSNSASIAWITMQKPVRVAIHADDMLPDDDS